MFTPMIPSVISFAFLISFLSALVFASLKFLAKSGSNIPIAADEITPMAPSFATADAKPDKEIPTPIPPWMIGTCTSKSPIFSPGILPVYLQLLTLLSINNSELLLSILK